MKSTIRSLRYLFVIGIIMNVGVPAFAANTRLTLNTIIPDTACPADTLQVCVTLKQNCGGASYLPLPDRPIYFYINAGNCGVDVGQAANDTVYTDSNGVACSYLSLPDSKGELSLRAKFNGEDKPCPSDPPNGVCHPNQRVQLSAANYCQVVYLDSAACSRPPDVSCPGDIAVLQCSLAEICLTGFTVTDPDGDLDSAWVSIGMLDGDNVCLTPNGEGVFEIVYSAVDLDSNYAACTTLVTVTLNSAPTVSLPSDTSIFLCDPAELCFPVDILDIDCDVVSVTSSLGQYSGTRSYFDQIERLNLLGATVSQVGGGAPGAVLYEASDFVGTVSSQTGVAVTLPNFGFAAGIVSYGTFPSGITPGNSAYHLLGPPTDLSFTTVGAGGPDGGDGDGSVTFGSGDYCVLGFGQVITTCDGSSSDLLIFTNSNSNGTAALEFRIGATVVYSTSRLLQSGAAGSGVGGVKLDLPDGISFDRLGIAWSAGSFGIDGFAARTAPSSADDDVCFTADTAGIYEVTVTAEDVCGNTGSATMYVTVDMNEPPAADAGADFTLFQCSFEQYCFGVTFSDPDDNLVLTELYSGPGSLVGSNICFTPAADGNFTFVIHAVDDCGLHDYDTVIVSVSDNNPPAADQPPTVTEAMCVAEEMCHDFTATDPNGGPLTWTHLGGVGSIAPDGHFCFTPTVTGTYSAAVIVTDSCGASDTTSILYSLTINTAPVATNPSSPAALSQCIPEEVCFQFEAADAEGGGLSWSLLSGPGTLTAGGMWCFTPTNAGSYSTTVAVGDSCGLADTTSLTYDITLNAGPTVALGADTSLQLCDPQQICISYTVSDPQGLTGLTEQLVTGGGTIDTAANQVCFTPTTYGCHDFVVQVTDPCGESDQDTVTACVTFGDFAQIDCPTEPIDVFLCDPDTVCQAFGITPTSATVYVSYGLYRNGALCFLADTSGTYVINVVAQAGCGSDTCRLVFNVDIGQAAQIDCPNPGSKFICAPGTVCVPVGIYGSGAVVTVSPIGSYSSGSLCFPADTSGHYEILVIATTDCGTDSCLVVRDITINNPPVAVGPSPVDTFVCAVGQVCYQFTASDVDDGSLTWSRLSGVGSVTTGGLWCFTAGAGSRSVVVKVSDACGAADTTTMTYNVSLNSPPTVNLGGDTTKFICASGIVCQPYSAGDPDNNLATIELLSPVGTLDTVDGDICFVPAVEDIYQFIVKVADSCGAVDSDTLNVTIEINQAPVVDAGDDQTIFACALEEICWAASVSDPDGNLTLVELIEGPGTLNGSSICFTPAGTYNYEFILKATDFCRLETVDTVAVYYTLNSPPTADAGTDQSFFQCSPAQICLPASCSDVDGNLTGCALVTAVGSYNGAQICFTPDTSGVYRFIIEATDLCGLTDHDTVLADVTINSGPVCVVPNDTLIFLCAPGQICLPAFGADVDGNLAFCQIVSGPGSLVGSEWCYMASSDQTVTVRLHCQDSCGAVCESQFTVQVDINGAPEIAFPGDTSIFLCDVEEICLPYIASDPDEPAPTTISLVSGPGVLDEPGSQVCFTPSDDGIYTFVIRIEDECGAFDEDTINVNVTVNSPPMADAGADGTYFLCTPGTQICWPASCSDVDGNIIGCNLVGPGEYDGSSICFNPTASGDYEFILEATDGCGLVVSDTVTIIVTNNSPPSIALGSDTSLFLCTPQQICLGYNVSDPDGLAGLIESMPSGYGTLDTAANQVCFTPTAGGSYQFVLRVIDPCGARDRDTIVVGVTFGATVQIDCPDDPFGVSLCQIETVCQALSITPSTASVSVSYGEFADGDVCFLADTSGVYDISVIAADACGSDTCLLTFNVEIGDTIYIDCPAPTTRFACAPGNICLPVGVYGAGAMVEVTPIGSHSAGQLCFPADTSGHYEILVVATTDCGIDSCLAVVDVTLNSAPYVEEMPPVDTFLCIIGQLCYQFVASDDDGESLTWNRISGDGTVSPDGEWCFDATESGSYSACAEVVDGCGAADTLCATKNVTVNTAPVITWTRDDATFLCDPGTICKQYTVIDPDDNSVVEQLLWPPGGTIDTVANEVCLVADTSGVYRLIVGATDGCGASDADTIVITIHLNSPPTVNAGSDQTVFQCSPTQLCWPASCSDPDNNLDSCYVTEGVGIYAAGQLCFTPDTTGVYTIVLRAVDECGDADEDTVMVDVTLNSAPVCDVAADTSYFQCVPTPVSRRVTAADVDGNFDRCEIITGPGSIVGDHWVYTPTADQSVKVRIMCLDDCGAFCQDSFTVSFDINSPPTVNSGANQTFFLCDPETRCWPVAAADPDGNLESVELLNGSEYATYNPGAGMICFPAPPNERYYTFVIKATDSCDAVAYDTTVISVQYNAPPTLELPGNPTVYLEEPGEVCFGIDADDEDGNLEQVNVTPIGSYNFTTQRICFQADSSGEFCMIVTAIDSCLESVTDTVCVTVVIDECIHVQIEKTHNAIQGLMKTVRIFLNGSGKALGGYDLLIAYDQSALSVQSVEPGVLLTDCGWEYFNYRHGPDGNCGNGCPSGILRILALAETNNGANHPGCFLDGLIGSIADIEFLVSDDRTLECQFVPVSFFWMDCGDNGFSDRIGDTLWVSRQVYSFENQNITDVTYGFPGYFGVPDECLIGGGPGKPAPIRCVDFTNGGVDIICADSIDARGDINLNGVANEVADAVVFSNYFVHGLSVFNVNLDGQIAATDANADGVTLSVADLVYLIRVIVGDSPPMPKFAPGETPEAKLAVRNGVLEIVASDYRIGAISVILEGEAEPKLHEQAAGMEMRYSFDGERTRVLIYNMEGRAFLETGPVLHLGGDVEVESVDVGSFDGFTLVSKINELPRDFHLAQNYPNPFNPSTTFEFALPVASEWKLVVYNVLGQTVRTWDGESEAGYVRIDWDASAYASGVYFYRLKAGEFTSTKKMVLLK